MDGSALEKGLDAMRMYDEFDDCRHLVDDLYDYGRENRVRPHDVEVAIDLAYGEYLQKMSELSPRRRSEERLRHLKVEALSGARTYISDMVHGRRSR